MQLPFCLLIALILCNLRNENKQSLEYDILRTIDAIDIHIGKFERKSKLESYGEDMLHIAECIICFPVITAADLLHQRQS